MSTDLIPQRADAGGVYAKLTDTSQYTGAHRERFDADGHGRGAAGRDVGGKGAGSTAGRGVSDLSQITRPNLSTSGSTTARSSGAAHAEFREAPRTARGGGGGGGGSSRAAPSSARLLAASSLRGVFDVS